MEIKDMNLEQAIGLLRWNLNQFQPYRNDWEMKSALDRIEELIDLNQTKLTKELTQEEKKTPPPPPSLPSLLIKEGTNIKGAFDVNR